MALGNRVKIVTFIFHGIKHYDPVTNQAHEIFISGDNQNLTSSFSPPMRQCRDDIISLKSFNPHRRQAKGFKKSRNKGKLYSQIRIHRRPLSFIRWKHSVPPGRTRQIKCRRNMGRPKIFENLHKHLTETKQSIGRLTGRGCQGPNRMKSTIDQSAGINQAKQF